MTRIPGVVLDVELSAPLPFVHALDTLGHRRDAAWVIVRLFTEPLAMVTLDLSDDLAPDALLAGIRAEAGHALGERLALVGLTVHDLTADGLALTAITGTPPYLAGRTRALHFAPPVTVVICTRERPDALRDCLISLTDQDFDRFDVLVVDNAPTSDRTRHVVDEFAPRLALRYVVEPGPGLSRARNAAIAALAGEPGERIVAWTDDDVRADPHWVAEVVRAFVENPAAAAVSGAVVPAELRTDAQVWFERFGGHSKGRGFVADEFGPLSGESPLYPLPAFGLGANMAFRLAALRKLRGFDEALGAGTPAQGGEDTLMFSRLLRGGATTLYRPSALVRRVHRADLDGLWNQLAAYGAGLTAFYVALIRSEPRVLLALIRLLPRVFRDFRAGGDFPRELLGASRRGMLAGPWRYLRGPRPAPPTKAVISPSRR
ncbi:glycosyltransferase [Cryptosporangium phraense]|uniref:Glycosyltransferase family 2 protein n=1 Tax=Cryptosporangium phraense TaxID=2593070 RepID=A0A545AG57_9ACTN|nr:glycosyltransferase family 2 protein [Cryptosporangium phraense]TQS40322.1 glycosyltransferase family 2 protein [Cryptosporangium phraense]